MNKQKFFNRNLWSVLLLSALTLMTTSCSDDDESDAITITIDDAAELVAFSVANRTYGAVNNLEYITNEVLAIINCGESQTNTFTFNDSSLIGDITVNAETFESYAQICEGEEETVTYAFNTNQVVTSDRYDTDHSIDGDWSISGVQEESEEITYNGPYNRTGIWTYNFEDNHTDETTYSSELKDLLVDPATGRITAGIATFTLEGTSTVYDPYFYEGSIEFLGSDISIITFDTGEQYELNLETGEITEIIN